MKLSKIKFGGGMIDDFELDFDDSDGKPARFVILAGENGTGKTTILNSIPTFLNKQADMPIKEALWILDENDIDELFEIDSEIVSTNNYHALNLSKQDIKESPTLKITKKQDDKPNTFVARISNTLDFNYIHGAHNIHSNSVQIYLNNLIFKLWHNNVEPNMPTVNGVSNYEIDGTNLGNTTQNIIDLNEGINIPQLLVDLNNKDAVEFQNHYIANGQANGSLVNIRMNRFREAFNAFFDNSLSFKKITTNHEVIFEKAGKEFNISGLSSGEKMVVQCGASLLKDAGARGITSVVLIDEPEQALHPKWQEKILDFYARTTSLNASRESQIFVATHSEHVLRNALSRSDALIILLRFSSVDRKLEAVKMSHEEYLLKYPSYDEIKYRAFGILSADYHDDLLGYIQESSGLGCHDQDIELLKEANCPRRHWVGKNRDKSINNNLDTDSLPFYIRHCMHHPELMNKNDNIKFEEPELKESVLFLEEYIKNTQI